MKVLILPSWYPSSENQIQGTFFKEQAKMISLKKKCNIYVISINKVSKFKSIKKTFTINRSKNQYFTELKIELINLKFSILNSIFRKIAEKFVLFYFINKFGKPDLIHLHSFSAGRMALWFNNKFKIPFMVTEHSSSFFRNKYPRKQLILAKQIFSNSSLNTAVSPELCKLLEKRFNSHFMYIPNFIDTGFFRNNSTTKEYTYISIGSLDENKNHIFLVKAFHKNFIKNNSLTLIIVGDGGKLKQLQGYIDQHKLNKNVFLFGKANRNKIKELLNSSSYYVHSSKYETFGISIIEAMSCGLPVVSTKCFGPEHIINNKTGILSEHNIEDFSIALNEILKNKYNSDYIRKYIINNFDKKIISTRILNEYKKIRKKNEI